MLRPTQATLVRNFLVELNPLGQTTFISGFRLNIKSIPMLNTNLKNTLLQRQNVRHYSDKLQEASVYLSAHSHSLIAAMT